MHNSETLVQLYKIQNKGCKVKIIDIILFKAMSSKLLNGNKAIAFQLIYGLYYMVLQKKGIQIYKIHIKGN